MPTARTSESHPLRITAMTLGDGRGRIGFSQCPGRIDRYAISGPWKRDLDTDLDAIQRWGATAVVSLIIHEEIAYLKVHDLPRAGGSCGMARTEMTEKPSRRVSEKVAATADDIRAAIEALTLADWARLRNYAANRTLKLGPKADDRSNEDLLQIALELLLDDTRRWDRTKVEFLPFMIGAMKSVSSNWARGYKPEETLSLVLDAEKTNKDGETWRCCTALAESEIRLWWWPRYVRA